MPPEFGRDVDRLLVLELRRELEPDESEPPDAAAELADAVTALRLATAGAIAAGPVVFERLDFRPLRVSPLLPIAATQPRGEATRLDKVRARAGRRAARAAARSPTRIVSSARRSTAGSCRSSRRSRFARRRCASRSPACSAATAARGRRRCARPCCSTEKGVERDRAARPARGRSDSVATHAMRCAGRSSRRSCTGTASTLVAALDETLLGLRPRPASVLRVA